MKAAAGFLAAVFAASLLSCSESPTEPRERREPIAFETVLAFSNSRIAVQRGELITDSGRWSAVWNEIQGNVLPEPPIPSVDFRNEMLVLAAMGVELDSCWRIEIESVKATGDRSLEVLVMEKRAPLSCICADVLVYPVHVVKLHRLDRRPNFRFVRRVSSGTCG